MLIIDKGVTNTCKKIQLKASDKDNSYSHMISLDSIVANLNNYPR